MKIVYIYIILFIISSCGNEKTTEFDRNIDRSQNSNPTTSSLVILGTIQDAGSPHIACKKQCCEGLFKNPDKERQVVSIGLFDETTNKKYLFEATPDMTRQVKVLKNFGASSDKEIADGIFLTHAHIGHYTGLMYLGKEATNAKNVPVYVMPKMKKYLETNGPWSQLVANNNIFLNEMEHEQGIQLSKDLEIVPFLVPHRDEYSETVGYKINGPNKNALFIPDIDKWEKWDKLIIEEIKKVDYAFLDATFYSGKELNNRDISQIPHPFIIESMKKFEVLDEKERKKVIFIHFNHTNPVINSNSKAHQMVIENGFNIATLHTVFPL